MEGSLSFDRSGFFGFFVFKFLTVSLLWPKQGFVALRLAYAYHKIKKSC